MGMGGGARSPVLFLCVFFCLCFFFNLFGCRFGKGGPRMLGGTWTPPGGRTKNS